MGSATAPLPLLSRNKDTAAKNRSVDQCGSVWINVDQCGRNGINVDEKSDADF